VVTKCLKFGSLTIHVRIPSSFTKHPTQYVSAVFLELHKLPECRSFLHKYFVV